MKSFPILASISLCLVPGGIGLNLPMPVMAQVAQNGLGADAILNDSYVLNMDGSQPSAALREEMRQLSWAVPVALGSKEIEDYTEAIRLNPDDAEAYYNRGLAYYEQGNLDKAIADYDEAIRLNPDDAQAYYNRAIAYYDRGNLDKAIADYQIAIDLNPDDAEAYYNRGLVYYQQGDLDKAIADYQIAIDLNPDDPDAYYNRGLAYRQQENNRQALESFRQAAELYQQQGKQEDYQDALERIRELE